MNTHKGYDSSREATFKCQECPKGLYSQEGATKCTLCPKGTYSSSTRAKENTKCSAGYYSDEEGAKTCKKCPVCTCGIPIRSYGT
ncbi:putative protein serine/threonine kinase [Histomonas meleagridis]|uniref:putative protein serine/threonine kinase n=1 Tax=Histomonas meleagridis TaxID=135588 RepID=UPI003559779E|nr:putative protein serine/threonine kinase [Histomonas meleagridis]KAH0802921.1 putative protein serine/threonine kinase [Histomonas meleagridis]